MVLPFCQLVDELEGQVSHLKVEGSRQWLANGGRLEMRERERERDVVRWLR